VGFYKITNEDFVEKQRSRA
jgi:hypothetical protein